MKKSSENPSVSTNIVTVVPNANLPTSGMMESFEVPEPMGISEFYYLNVAQPANSTTMGPGITNPSDALDSSMERMLRDLTPLRGSGIFDDLFRNTSWDGIALIKIPDARRLAIDLHHIFQRLLETRTPSVASIWLRSFNSALNARPVDVLKLRGAAPVIDAIDTSDSDSFA